jgi:basic membrane lipoprotein Med (substrate-binding protein (PBP1-ABC) superfamily)
VVEPTPNETVRPIDEIVSQCLSREAGDEASLLLVIDQFEELFATTIDEAERRGFLDGLVAVLDDPDRKVYVLVTLRADYYDRPLLYPCFGSRFASGVVNVMPMDPEELEAAAVEPARAVGVTVEPALLAALIADASNQPGSLPLFEYALTELFEAATDRRLTIDHYQQIGGIRGALTRRADALYARLTPEQQEAARQIFLRLVAVHDPGGSSLRRVRARELADLDIDSVATQTVIELYGAHRLLSFDRDPLSGDPVIEVAHEALLREWTRLRTWVDDHREDLRRRASLTVYARDWTTAARDPDYLLSGTRLERYERWAASAGLALTSAERTFLHASLALRDTLATEEAERAARLERLEHRAREPGYVLGPSAPHVPFWPWPARLSQLRPPPARVALMSEGRGDLAWNDQIAAGLNRAVRHFGIQAIEVAPVIDPEGEARGLAETGFDLIFIPGLYIAAMNVACDYPETFFACIDYSAWAISPDHIELPNVVGLDFASEEGSFLVGAAAAMTTQTGKIGFVGGMDIPVISQFEAGYVAGARMVDETVEVMVIFVSESEAWEAFSRPDLGRLACRTLFERGADVVFAAAGKSGEGGLDAAAEASPPDHHRWIIGADVDRHDALPRAGREHLLTTMLKRTDVAVHQTTESLVDGSLEAGLHVLGLAENGVGYSTSGGYLEPLVPRLAAIREAIVAGDIIVPTSPDPSRLVLPGPTVAAVTDLVTLEFDGRRCRYDGPERFTQDAVLRIAAKNEQDHPIWVVVARIPDDDPDFGSTPISVATMPAYILDDTAVVAEIEPGSARMTVPLSRGRYLLACLTLLDEPAMVLPAAQLQAARDCGARTASHRQHHR